MPMNPATVTGQGVFMINNTDYRAPKVGIISQTAKVESPPRLMVQTKNGFITGL
jgi:hypothetical protein